MRRLLVDDAYAELSQALTMRHLRKGRLRESDRWVLSWRGLKEDFDRCVNTYQAPVITEFATLGLACVCVRRYTRMQITEVTLRGEKADYWLGRKRFLLEVSGQSGGQIDVLLREKTKQLLSNPYRKSGFVCVADYEKRVGIFKYYANRRR